MMLETNQTIQTTYDKLKSQLADTLRKKTKERK